MPVYVLDTALRDDLRPGLSIHMNPDVLAERGATFSCPPHRRVLGNHYFACIEVLGTRAIFVVLYSDSQCSIEDSEREGDWGYASSTYHPDQVWNVPISEIAIAAALGKDNSSAGNRRYISASALGRIQRDCNKGITALAA
ncbi:MAG TPA: hypothetical protein VE028_01325 [Nitratidesulfovibrio sp.]|nr:hypothetical protein [Nitratidesulfovibrio sp.]